MKKYFAMAAVVLLGLSACQNVEKEQAPVSGETVLTLSATLGESGTRTVYVPEGGKVNWVAGDKIGAKYPAGKDNATLTLVSGAGTTSATFSGKIANTTNSNLADNPSDFVFYYPIVSGVGQGGTVTDADNYTLTNTFPKVQNAADLLFEANWMVGSAKAQEFLTTVGQTDTALFAVSMKNLMAVLDLTVKGSTSIKRIFLTDPDPSAPALFGKETLTVKGGEIESLTLDGTGSEVQNRTIIAEFNKPIALSEAGTHIYVTVFPRAFAKGLQVVFEAWNGDYMIKNLAESEGFTLASGKVYQVPEVTFAPSETAGKGFYDGVEYDFETFVDPRNREEYRVATLKDGRTWMLQGLRYVPTGITPSSSLSDVNAGVWFPVVMNAAGTGMVFGDALDVSKYGYNYNFSTAMGLDPDHIYNLLKEVLAGTKTQAAVLAELKALEGKQGICPDGWHVPTQAEYNALYTASGGSIGSLGVQGFVLKDQGAVMVANPTATNDPTAATYLGWANNKLNTGYYLLSSVYSYNMAKAIMPNVTNDTAAVANMVIRAGAPLRCIKDK